MNIDNQQWETLLREARSEAPAVISTMALTVFSTAPSMGDTKRIAANIVRNLLAYLVRLSVKYYSAQPPHELSREISRFLNELLVWMKDEDGFGLFLERRIHPLSKTETETVFRRAKLFPNPPSDIMERIIRSHSFLPELLFLENTNADTACAQLYHLASKWNIMLSQKEMQLFPESKPFEFAAIHIMKNIRRSDSHTAKSIVWGKELCEILQKYRDMGVCERTARAKTRRDFIAAHPLPKNDAELLLTESFPGHSRPAILRYMQKYQESLHNTGDA